MLLGIDSERSKNMKLSTRIMRDAPWYDEHDPDTEIVLMVNCGDFVVRRCQLLKSADEDHEQLTKEFGCTLLPQESPVINDSGEIIYHYTSTNYRDWCNSAWRG